MMALFAAGSRFLKVLFWVSLALVTLLSLAPLAGGKMAFPHQDKVFHAAAYLYFYSLGWRAMASAANGQLPWHFGLFAGLMGYGLLIELVQGAIGYRDLDPLDLAANGAGLCFGVAAVALFVCWRDRKARMIGQGVNSPPRA